MSADPGVEALRMEFEELAGWLRVEAKRQLEGCRRLAHDGFTQCYTPDGVGRYNALWTRDFCYMVEGYPEAISEVDLRNAVEYLLAGCRADGVAPDRVQADGRAVYSAGPAGKPMAAPPTDNAQFLVKLVCRMATRLGESAVMRRHGATLEAAMGSIPRRADGLVSIDPGGPPRSPYGFTDTVAKTGAVLFSSLLYWEACRAMTTLYERESDLDNAARWRADSERLQIALNALWDGAEGILLAASEQCRQPDVWGSAYACYLGAIEGSRADAVAAWLVRHYDEIVWKGMVRHIREADGWQKLLAPYAAGRYQNGAYWPVPTVWLVATLRRVNPDIARRTLLDLLRHMRERGVNEWEKKDGTVGVPDYVASATLALLAVKEQEALDR